MNRDLIGSLAFLALGAAGLYWARDLPFGTASVPGPAMQPVALSVLIMVLAAVHGVRALRLRASGAAAQPPLGAGYRRVLLAVICLAVYVAAMGVLGFALSTFLCMWALYALAADHPLGWQPALAGAILTAATVLLFGVLLKVHTPAGTLWN
jgi:uncharacterized BrkB/YihY/UPF0761 family membrane protein